VKPNLLELSRPDKAATYLGGHLFSGSLALLLGAGVSMPLGLPSWKALVDGCLESLGSERYAGPDLELGGTKVVRLCGEQRLDPRQLLEDVLYRNASNDSASLMGNRRLGSLGAMLMGSRRGTVNNVVTLNFDSLLEKYLALHGYVTRTVTDLPAITGNEDVTVYHMHGYVPSAKAPPSSPRTGEIIFSKDDMNKRVGEQNGRWPLLLRNFARSKVLLLLGMSPSSSIGNNIGPLFKDEADAIASVRPTAFWIGADPLDEDIRHTLVSANVVPVVLPCHEDLDDFLLQICRAAAAQMRPAIL
jgi:hypothetical protein